MELVPSRDKEKAWDTYQAMRDQLPGLPTARKLEKLHEIATAHYDLTLPEEIIQSMEHQLLMHDRPDGIRLRDVAEQTLKNFEGRDFPLYEVERSLEDAVVAAARENTIVNVERNIRGKVRTLGTRSIDGRPSETIHGSHTCVFETPGSSLGLGMPRAYFGLSQGLGETYEQMCITYDTLKEQAATPADRIMAEAFLQLVGTRVLHPFWDANGRTFGLHLAETLHELGTPLNSYRELQRIVTDLTQPNEDFLQYVLSEANIGLIAEESDYLMMKFNPTFRDEYMRRLRITLQDTIAHSVDPEQLTILHYDTAAEIIERASASKKGTAYQRTRFPKEKFLEKAIEEDRAGLYHGGIFNPRITAFGISDKIGNPIARITLSDLHLTEQEREAYTTAAELQQMRDKTYDARSEVARLWIDQHSLPYGAIRGIRNKHIRKAAEFIYGFFDKDIARKREIEQLAQEGNVLPFEAASAAGAITDDIYQRRVKAAPYEGMTSEQRTGAEALKERMRQFSAKAAIYSAQEQDLKVSDNTGIQ